MNPAEQVRQYIDATKTPKKLAARSLGAAELYPTEVFEILTERLARPAASQETRITELALVAEIGERLARRKKGLPERNALSVEDLNFALTRPSLNVLIKAATAHIDAAPNVDTCALLGDAFASKGDHGRAEQAYVQLRTPESDHLAAVTSFDPAFHATLADEGINGFAGFPAVEILRSAPSALHEIIFVSADQAYFHKYGWALLDSAASHPSSARFILHIMDLEAAERGEVFARLAGYGALVAEVSTEWTGLRADPVTPKAAGYYHAARYIRFAEVLARHPAAAAWILDVDLIARGSLAFLFNILKRGDIALHLNAARLHVRNKVLAGYIGIAPTQLGREYLFRVAAYIAHFARKNQLPWGVDQVAAYAVLVGMFSARPELSVASIPPEIAAPETGLFIAGKS